MFDAPLTVLDLNCRLEASKREREREREEEKMKLKEMINKVIIIAVVIMIIILIILNWEMMKILEICSMKLMVLINYLIS